jgi:hypothetical protein
MAQKRESALQRIQVGVVGLVVVLLFVSLANMVMDRAFVGDSNGGAGITGVLFEKDTPDEPLAELGVTPVVESEELSRAKQAVNPAAQPNRPRNQQAAPSQ